MIIYLHTDIELSDFAIIRTHKPINCSIHQRDRLYKLQMTFIDQE